MKLKERVSMTRVLPSRRTCFALRLFKTTLSHCTKARMRARTCMPRSCPVTSHTCDICMCAASIFNCECVEKIPLVSSTTPPNPHEQFRTFRFCEHIIFLLVGPCCCHSQLCSNVIMSWAATMGMKMALWMVCALLGTCLANGNISFTFDCCLF